jgi:micrococcal nuclease
MNRRYHRSYRPVFGWAILFALLLAVRWWTVDISPEPKALAEGLHTIVRVVDGDTLLVDSGERVRLQGIDTPETVRENYPVEDWGPEAKAFTESFVRQANGQLRLTFSAERIDRFCRHLAFAWHHDKMLNEELVRAGLARARLEFRYSGLMKRRLERAQHEAQAARRGIWTQ